MAETYEQHQALCRCTGDALDMWICDHCMDYCTGLARAVIEATSALTEPSPLERVRQRAEAIHTRCTANDEPVDEAFCTCWGIACGVVGPCGGCYVCNPDPTPEVTQ